MTKSIPVVSRVGLLGQDFRTVEGPPAIVKRLLMWCAGLCWQPFCERQAAAAPPLDPVAPPRPDQQCGGGRAGGGKMGWGRIGGAGSAAGGWIRWQGRVPSPSLPSSVLPTASTGAGGRWAKLGSRGSRKSSSCKTQSCGPDLLGGLYRETKSQEGKMCVPNK